MMLMKVSPERSLARRLRPLKVAAALQAVILWVPVEKLFMSEIGFTPASVGVMAAGYAAVVPLLEVPSGILADRWSRRGVLVIAGIALAVSALAGGLSTGVPTYILSMMVLGAYFAAYSGTIDSVVYDTVLAETGDGDAYKRQIGSVRLLESVALVTSSLAGGWLAGVIGLRTTYFLTVPFALLSIVALFRFAEPQLHRAGERTTLRRQVAVTFRTLAGGGRLLPVVAMAMLTAMLMNVLYEFGPLWLVALAVPAVLFGPFWAALVSTIGLGGLLAGRIDLGRPPVAVGAGLLMTAAGWMLTSTHQLVLVTLAQVLLALLAMAVSIHAGALLHDAVPSTVRSGVMSGVGALSWIAFVPFSLVFGLISERAGVWAAAWMITGTAVVVTLGLIRSAMRTTAPAPVPA